MICIYISVIEGDNSDILATLKTRPNYVCLCIYCQTQIYNIVVKDTILLYVFDSHNKQIHIGSVPYQSYADI